MSDGINAMIGLGFVIVFPLCFMILAKLWRPRAAAGGSAGKPDAAKA